METLFSKAEMLQYILEADGGGCAFLMEKNEGGRGEGACGAARAFLFIFPWVFLLVFQAQFFLVRKELAAIKLQLSVPGNSALENKSLTKRSTGEKDAVKKVSGVDAVHLQPTFPFQKIDKDGRIGPWSLSPLDNALVTLKADNTEVELVAKGIYHIYAQIYYLTNHSSNSYHIVTYNGTEKREHRTLSTCACQGRNVMGEVSCYTGFTGTFNRGDRLYLHQIERGRIINNSRGCSFLGVVFLRKVAGNWRRKP